MGAHAEHEALLLGGLVHLAQLLLELAAGDVRASGVDHIQDHLPALQETVGDELAGPQGDGRVRVLYSVSIPHRRVCSMR